MAIYGVSITKRCTFRGQPQEFSNTYYYEGPIIGGGDVEDLINKIVVIEKELHSTDVTFVFGRGWSASGAPSENEMMADGPLSGTGSYPPNTSMDRERAFLIQWPAGNNVRGRPVYLRKWYHSCGACKAVTPSASVLQNTAKIPPGDLTIIENEANKLNAMNAGTNSMTLGAKSGRDRTGGAIAYPWLEHHQLGNQWR
jgi:hypothetical protein